jgi:Holliday junction resolvase RusA-like endonuclease
VGQATSKDAMRILSQQRRKVGLAEDSSNGSAASVLSAVSSRTTLAGPWSAMQQRTGTIWLILPYPPSANRYWRHAVTRGRLMTYISKEAERFKDTVAKVCAAAGIRTIRNSVDLTIWQYRPQRSGDTDNRIKVVQDALQGWAYEDDDLVTDVEAHRRDDPTRPRIAVRIQPRQLILGKDDHDDHRGDTEA